MILISVITIAIKGGNIIEPIRYCFEEPLSLKECLEIDLNYIKDKINKFKSKMMNNCDILINTINKKTIKTCKKMIVINSITKLKKNFPSEARLLTLSDYPYINMVMLCLLHGVSMIHVFYLNIMNIKSET